MVDLFPDSPGAKANTYLAWMFGIAVINSFWIGITGYQDVEIQLILSGLIFIPLIYGSDILSRGQIRKALGGFGAMAFSLTIPLTITEILRLVFTSSTQVFSSAQNSLFSLPSQGFYAGILKGLPETGIFQFNGFVAPIIETAPVVAVTIISYRSISGFLQWTGMPRIQSRIIAALISPIFGGMVFALFHPFSRGIAFFIAAIFIVVYIPMVAVLLEDATARTLVKVAGFGVGTVAGWHIGINIAQMGGLLAWSGTVLSTKALFQSPKLFVTGLVSVGFIIVSYLASIWYLLSFGGRFRLRSVVRSLV